MSKFTIDNQRMVRMLVTPSIASEWLGNLYEKQRRFRDQFTSGYATDMRDQNWNPNNPSPIVISVNGKLMDGQHRLQAVVNSGVSIMMWVCFDADEGIYDFLDNGHPRSLYDRDLDIPDKLNVFALTRRIVALDKGASLVGAINGKTVVTQQQQISYLNKNLPYVLSCNRVGGRMSDRVGVGPKSAYATVVHMATVIWGDGVQSRMEAFVNEPSESLMVMQRTLSRMYANSVSPRTVDVVPKIINAFDVYIEGRVCRSLNKNDWYVDKWEKAYREARGIA